MKLYELKHKNEHNTSCDVYSGTKRLYPAFIQIFNSLLLAVKLQQEQRTHVMYKLQVIMWHAQTKKDYLSDRKWKLLLTMNINDIN